MLKKNVIIIAIAYLKLKRNKRNHHESKVKRYVYSDCSFVEQLPF